MKLTFSILWFDDTEEFFDSIDMEPLEEAVRSWGFEPVVKFVSDPDEFMSYEPFKEYDLIVVDYNLEEYDDYGQNFIKKIRSHDVYTEVIFYSANPASELWDAVRDLELEGVFISNRTGILTKIQRVGEQSVSKVLDLENMRGIVMAEVGDIDLILERIIEKGLGSLDEEKLSQVYQGFYARSGDQAQKVCSALEKFKQSPSPEVLISLCSDSYKKWNVVQSIAKRCDEVSLDDVGDYNSEVIQPRNYLAHGKPSIESDGSCTFDYRGRQFTFNDEIGRDLRKTISSFKEAFEGVM